MNIIDVSLAPAAPSVADEPSPAPAVPDDSGFEDQLTEELTPAEGSAAPVSAAPPAIAPPPPAAPVTDGPVEGSGVLPVSVAPVPNGVDPNLWPIESDGTDPLPVEVIEPPSPDSSDDDAGNTASTVPSEQVFTVQVPPTTEPIPPAVTSTATAASPGPVGVPRGLQILPASPAVSHLLPVDHRSGIASDAPPAPPPNLFGAAARSPVATGSTANAIATPLPAGGSSPAESETHPAAIEPSADAPGGAAAAGASAVVAASNAWENVASQTAAAIGDVTPQDGIGPLEAAAGSGERVAEAAPADAPGSGTASPPLAAHSAPPHAEGGVSVVPNAEQEQMPAVDRGEFAERVSDAVRAAHGEQRPLRVRLTPPELGTLQVEVAVQEGRLTARLEVQTAATQQILLDSLSLLHDALAQHGTTLDRIDVQLAPPPQEGAPRDGADQRGRSSGQGQSSPRDGQPQQRQPQDAPPRQPPSRSPAALEQIDIEV